MTSIFKERSVKTRCIIIVVLFLVMFLLMIVADYPGAVERYYSQGLYPIICHIFHPVFDLFPFSVGDILYIVVIIYLLYLIFKFIKLAFIGDWKPAGILVLGIIIRTQAVVIAFYLLWGMNYYRPSAGERLKLADTSYNLADLKAVTAQLIDSANACRERVTNIDLFQPNKEIYQTAIRSTQRLADSSAGFGTYKPRIKSSLLTPLLNYIGTSGYYNPFTSESQMNYEMPMFVRPFVACHELSHQAGFAPEDEANFAGFLAATHSKSNFFRYSAYYVGVQEFMFALKMQDSVARKELKKRISPQVLNDLKTERDYWLKYQGRIERISSVFYDSFLKANNQPQGLRTYNRMVLLILAYRKKHQL